MAKVYTKTGDKGSCSLLTGERVSKASQRIRTYGLSDHLNSTLGVAIASIDDDLINFKNELISLQSLIFHMGALISCPSSDWEKYKLRLITEEDILKIEESIDNMDKDLDKLKNFILPGGGLTSSYLHMCRTTCRTLEQYLVELIEKEEQKLDMVGKLVNRLSDYFFTASRFYNKKKNIEELIWKPS